MTGGSPKALAKRLAYFITNSFRSNAFGLKTKEETQGKAEEESSR